MLTLNNLKNDSAKKSKIQRVGRGPGSHRGKTSCRGQKGAGSRSGYKRRYGYEGGQMRLFAKLPHRGFSRGRFEKETLILNLCDIEKHYQDGEKVNFESLYEKGLAKRIHKGHIKILSQGELTKKVEIEGINFSSQAQKKLEEKKIKFNLAGE